MAPDSGFDVNNDAHAAAGANAAQLIARQRDVNECGWIVGFGSEYALIGGWSVKSEWLYADFGPLHYTSTFRPRRAPAVAVASPTRRQTVRSTSGGLA